MLQQQPHYQMHSQQVTTTPAFNVTTTTKLSTVFTTSYYNSCRPGCVAQSVTCLATDACLTADPGIPSSITSRSHTFVEIDHEIISTVILLPFADSFKKVVVSYKGKYVHKLLVNRLLEPAQENVWLSELTVPQ